MGAGRKCCDVDVDATLDGMRGQPRTIWLLVRLNRRPELYSSLIPATSLGSQRSESHYTTGYLACEFCLRESHGPSRCTCILSYYVRSRLQRIGRRVGDRPFKQRRPQPLPLGSPGILRSQPGVQPSGRLRWPAGAGVRVTSSGKLVLGGRRRATNARHRQARYLRRWGYNAAGA